MAVLKGYIKSSGLSRLLYTHLNNYHCATISACRSYRREAYTIFREQLNKGVEMWKIPDSDAYLVSKKENKLRNADLGNRLYRAGGFTGITQINGVFHEQGAEKPSLELSYMLFCDDYDYLYDNMLKLGELYEQDSVCVIERGAVSGAEIKTSPKDIDGYSGIPQFAPVRKFKGTQAGDSSSYYEKNEGKLQAFFSSINGRPFRFSEVKASATKLHGIQTLIPELKASDYRFVKGDYLLPAQVVTTKGNILTSYCEGMLSGDNTLQRRLIKKFWRD